MIPFVSLAPLPAGLLFSALWDSMPLPYNGLLFL
jgi:hypothetical protein